MAGMTADKTVASMVDSMVLQSAATTGALMAEWMVAVMAVSLEEKMAALKGYLLAD